jgi:23S rRNA (adenine2503-C2)-methyltransferase
VVEPKPAILSVPGAELDVWFAAQGEAAFRRRQVMAWVARGAVSFEEMQDVPRSLRGRLDEAFRITSLRPVATSEADTGLTTKTLFELDGGHTVEAVVMRYSDRSTLCISSQAGCPVGCPFCATGKFPFGRNLHANEIEEQAIDAARRLGAGVDASRTSSSWAWASRSSTTRR